MDPHDINDMLTLNGRLRQANRDAMSLLTDALHALRHGHTDIAQELVDRTIINLHRTNQ